MRTADIGLPCCGAESGEFEKGLKYHLEALEVGQKYNDKFGVISTYIFISEDYIKLKKLDVALSYAKKSLELAKEIGLKGEEKIAS